MTDRHLTPDERIAQAIEDYRADVRRTLDAYEIEQIERQVSAEIHAEAHGSACDCEVFND